MAKSFRINVSVQDLGAHYKDPQGDSAISFDVVSDDDAATVAVAVISSLVRVAIGNQDAAKKEKEIEA